MITKKFSLKLMRRVLAGHAYGLTWDRPEHRYLTAIYVLKFGCRSIAHLSALSAQLRAAAGAKPENALAGEFMGGTSCGAEIPEEELFELFTEWVKGLDLPTAYLVLHISVCGRVDFHLFTPQYDAAGRTLRQRGILTTMKTTIRPLITALNEKRLARGDFSIVNTTARGKPFFAELPPPEPALEIEVAPPEPEPEATPLPPSLPTFRGPAQKPSAKPAEPPLQKGWSIPPIPSGLSSDHSKKSAEEDEKAKKKKEEAVRAQITFLRLALNFRAALAAAREHLKEMAKDKREIPAAWRESEVRAIAQLDEADDHACQYAYLIDTYTPSLKDDADLGPGVSPPNSPAPHATTFTPERTTPPIPDRRGRVHEI